MNAVGQTGLTSRLDTTFVAQMGTAHLPVGITIGGILLDANFTRETAGTDVASSNLQIGIIVADETVGGEVERPLDDPHADWLWQQQIAFPAVAAGTSVSTWDVMGGPIRVRAKRKAEELGQNLFLVAQGYDIAPTFDISYFSSVLMLLP